MALQTAHHFMQHQCRQLKSDAYVIKHVCIEKAQFIRKEKRNFMKMIIFARLFMLLGGGKQKMVNISTLLQIVNLIPVHLSYIHQEVENPA